MPKGRPIDLTGRRFGGWTVIERSPLRKKGRALWLCRCDCGTEQAVQSGNLLYGNSTRCRPCGSSREHNARWNKA